MRTVRAHSCRISRGAKTFLCRETSQKNVTIRLTFTRPRTFFFFASVLTDVTWLIFQKPALNLHKKKLLKPFYFLPFHTAGAITLLPFNLPSVSTLHICGTRMTGCWWGVSEQFQKSVWTALFLQALLTAGPRIELCVALGSCEKVRTVDFLPTFRHEVFRILNVHLRTCNIHLHLHASVGTPNWFSARRSWRHWNYKHDLLLWTYACFVY